MWATSSSNNKTQNKYTSDRNSPHLNEIGNWCFLFIRFVSFIFFLSKIARTPKDGHAHWGTHNVHKYDSFCDWILPSKWMYKTEIKRKVKKWPPETDSRRSNKRDNQHTVEGRQGQTKCIKIQFNVAYTIWSSMNAFRSLSSLANGELDILFISTETILQTKQSRALHLCVFGVKRILCTLYRLRKMIKLANQTDWNRIENCKRNRNHRSPMEH